MTEAVHRVPLVQLATKAVSDALAAASLQKGRCQRAAAKAAVDIETEADATRADSAFSKLDTEAARAKDTLDSAHGVLQNDVTLAQATLARAVTRLSSDPDLLSLTAVHANIITERDALLAARLQPLVTAQDECEKAVVAAVAVIDAMLKDIQLSYNKSSDALDDALKTEVIGGIARGNNLSAHTVGDLVVKPGNVKGGAPTMATSKEWFQQRFDTDDWHREFASFWSHGKPRDVQVFFSDDKAKELGLSDATLVSGSAAVDTAKATTGKKVKRTMTQAEIRPVVWTNTMGDCASGPCVLCEVVVIHRTKRKGFEMAHITSNLDKGAATPANLAATCSACNGEMAGQSMQSWISTRIKEGGRRDCLNALMERILAVPLQ
jgi:hypothetical protein